MRIGPFLPLLMAAASGARSEQANVRFLSRAEDSAALTGGAARAAVLPERKRRSTSTTAF